jgi:hypothetical protein
VLIVWNIIRWFVICKASPENHHQEWSFFMVFFRILFCTFFMLAVASSQAGWGSGGPRGGGGGQQSQGLTSHEAEQLSYLREEEKLARDLYQLFYRQWGLVVFSNIAGAEQRHMDAVLNQLQRHALNDPALDQAGVFSNQELQQLYDSLVSQGMASQTAALWVGALVEEVDMQDLDTMIGSTDKEDLISLYEKLHCGSRNHLRAFVRQIESRGEVYTAQVLSQQAVDRIVDSPMERRCGRSY